MASVPNLHVVFFRTESGREPVREWLLELDKESRKNIGEDVKWLQYRWPVGMPLVRKLEADLWEVRSQLPDKGIARIFFTIQADQLALLHAFVKKSQKTPQADLELARHRKNLWLRK